MTHTPPEQPGPPARFWDALPQIIGKLTNEFLLVTLGILILVVAIGVFAPGVVESLGRAFFYLLVVLAWLAYLIVRALDAWLKLRAPSEAPTAPPSAPGVREGEEGGAEPEPAPVAFDQRDQAVHGPQTNVGQSEGPILSGTFHGPVTVGSTPAPSPTAAEALSEADQREVERLYGVLNARFDQEELRTLCFRLGVDYDSLRGEGKAAKARELALYMSRTGGLARLRAAIQAERPGVL
jgi:hypothetical protein